MWSSRRILSLFPGLAWLVHRRPQFTEKEGVLTSRITLGLTGIMIGAAPGTANTPRAHITNMAAVGTFYPGRTLRKCLLTIANQYCARFIECLRDIGLERDVKQVASTGHCMIHTRWCHSMAGAEYARLYSWGNDPMRKVSESTDKLPCLCLGLDLVY